MNSVDSCPYKWPSPILVLPVSLTKGLSMSQKPKVFLSYAREDRDRVEQIYDSLKAEGFNPWIDTRNIRAGEKWSSVIGEAIRSADFMLLFLSHNSVSKRGYVQTELRAALSILAELPENAIFLIPVRLDESEPPAPLQHIQFVDLFEESGWERLLRSLSGSAEQNQIQKAPIRAVREEIKEDEKEKKKQQRSRPHIFVAMPFAVEMEDVFYYGIQRAVEANGFEPIRVDKSAFTGDILDQIKTSIQGSVAVVVELTGLNPNVHLELGYAWGNDIPCILLLKDGGELCFDVRGQKCLNYQTIKELEIMLTEEIARLKKNGSINAVPN